jgi:putative aldouronate transport system permease protein
MMVHKNVTATDYFYTAMLYVLLALSAIVMIIPFVSIVASSFATPIEIASSNFLIFPRKFTLNNYRFIFSTNTTMRAMFVSFYITISATVISMTLNTITAYALSIRYLKFRKQMMLAIIFTMLFNPGMIANYITFRSYHLINSYFALLLPRAINVFYLLLLKNFFQEISEELKEAATIDGCGPFGIFLKIVLPLSLPALATFTLFYAVDNWNAFFDALLYINDPKKWPITIIMRQVVLMASSAGGAEAAAEMEVSPTAMRMATVTLAILPILGSYPFLQRYFQSGLMVGSIKG